jgi:hypothetical protein
MKRADLDKWAAIAAQKPVRILQASKKPAPLVMREQPGIRTLEDCILLHASDTVCVERTINETAQRLFGIVPDDCVFCWPAGVLELPEDSPEVVAMARLWNEHEQQFEIHDSLTDDETMEELAKLGVDFSDERGHPLRCTKPLGRVAEAAARGLKGRLPELALAADTKWEDALAAERDAFLAKKRRG